MKKTLILILLVTLVNSALGFTQVSHVAAASTSLAELMPVDTFFFAEMNTADLPGTVRTIADLLKRVSSPTDLVGEIEHSLSQALSRPATLEKDIASWLGDRVGVGMYVPDELFNSIFTRGQTKAQPEYYVVAMVKDETAADAFLKDALAAITKAGETLTRSTDKIGGADVAIYATGAGSQVIARWKGYVALGSPSISRFIDVLKNKKPTLATDPTYQKVVGMLKPDNFATVYCKTPLSPIEYVGVLAMLGPSVGNVFVNIMDGLERTPGAKPTATPTPTPTPTPVPELFDLARLVRNMGATAMGFYGDAKQIAVDFAFYANPDNLKEVLTALKIPADVQLGAPAPSISLKMAERVSNQAMGVIIGSNATELAQNGLVLVKATAKMLDIMEGRGSSSSQEIDRTYAQFESGLKQAFDLDLTQDVLGWMSGEYALYMMLDPRQSPFSYTLLMDAPEPGKVETLLTKLNAGLPKSVGLTPTKAEGGLFTIAPSTYNPPFGYGLVKNEFLVHIGSELSTVVNAGRGDGVLASDATWKETITLLPKSYQHVWYLNVLKLSAALQKITTGNPSDQQLIALTGLFKSVLLYSTDFGGGSSLTTVALLPK